MNTTPHTSPPPDNLTVYELGEETDAWFVEGATTYLEARLAVAAWLDKALGTMEKDRLQAHENLRRATAEKGKWWFATGHREGEMISAEEPPTWLEGIRLQ